jgi:type III secretion protein V
VFPALVKAARSTVSTEQITAVLRNLLAEGVSVRNLRLILERLTDYQLRKDAGSHLVLDETPTSMDPGDAASGNNLGDLTEFVRAGMKREISGKFSRETNTLVVYLLDRNIEELVSRNHSANSDAKLNSSLDQELQDKVLQSIRQEMTYLPPTAQLPLILTTSGRRAAVRKIIAHEFPRLGVVAYPELMPDLNVMPVARISLESAARS